MQYLNWEPAFIVVRTRVLCMVCVWVTWATCLQLEGWDRFLCNCLHWTKHAPLASSGNPWQMNFRTLTTCSGCSEVSLFPDKHTQQGFHTVGSAGSNATFPLSCTRTGWGKAGTSSLCSQLDCSLPCTPSSEELQCSCLVFLLGDYRNPVFYSSFESPFLQHVTWVALGFLWRGVSQDRVSKCRDFVILTSSWATSLLWDWLCLLFSRP